MSEFRVESFSVQIEMTTHHRVKLGAEENEPIAVARKKHNGIFFYIDVWRLRESYGVVKNWLHESATDFSNDSSSWIETIESLCELVAIVNNQKARQNLTSRSRLI